MKELVSEDDDPTAELEIPNFKPLDDAEGLQAERESDSHTCGLGETDELRTQRGQTIPELQSDLESRSKTIGRLQYDIQQLRSKWLGLEAEIGAREEIVTKLLSDADELNKSISRKDKLLKKRSSSIKSLKSTIAQRDKDRLALEEKLAEQESASADGLKAREAAQKELEDIRGQLDAARSEIATAEAELEQRDKDRLALEEKLAEQESANADGLKERKATQKELGDVRGQLDAARAEIADAEAELEQRDKDRLALEEKLAEQESASADGLKARDAAQRELDDVRGQLDAAHAEIAAAEAELEQRDKDRLALEEKLAAQESASAGSLKARDAAQRELEDVCDQLNAAHAEIAAAEAELEQRNKDRLALEEKLAAQESASTDSFEARDAARRELEDVRDQLNLARSEIADAEAKLGQREASYAQLEQQLSDQQESTAEHAATLERTKIELGELKTELEATQKENNDLNVEVNLRDELESSYEQRLTGLDEELASKRIAEANYAEELAAAAKELGRLNLELESARQQSAADVEQTQKNTASVVSELQAQREKTEQYADSLRYKLEDSNESLSQMTAQRDKLSSEVLGLTERYGGIAGELEATRSANEELASSLEQLKADHEQEIRMLRFELTEAEESVTQTGHLNAQLAADLMTTRDAQEDLEKALQDKEQEAENRSSELEKQLDSLSSKADELEQKLETKNTAINVLLGELEKKTEQIESIGEIDEVIQEIDNRMSERFDEPVRDRHGAIGSTPINSERDRITRVLVGSIGAQELRFPLFKNRLTIGRTADNDIQLKTAYISRRHAVVLTEGDATRVIDWGSKNGVYVNSERVKECFLANGDIVGVGNAKFRYEERPKRDA